MIAAVDCHMVGQAAAGDAGNGRYAATLTSALHAHAAPGDRVAALVATPAGRTSLAGAAHTLLDVPGNDLARLGHRAGRTLAGAGAQAAVFTYIAPLRMPCPVLLAVHDATFMWAPQWLAPRPRHLLRTLVPRAARRAHTVLALSHTAAADLSEALGVPPERIRVVSPPPAPAFTPDPDGGAPARVHARFGLRDYCLAVGDLGPRKNLVALGEAIRRLGPAAPPLALVGKPGPGGEAIARASGARWLGHVDDATLADLYRAAAVTAYPSLYEGFGLPAVEAMACGCPVVASDRGALPEVTDGAAILVAPRADAIAQGIRAALEPAEADRLRAAGPARAARYSAPAMAGAAWGALHAAAGSDPPVPAP